MRQAAEQLIVITETPSAPEFLALATACRNLRDFDAASEAAERAWERAAWSPEITMMRALIAFERGDGELAILRFRELASRAPHNPRWVFELVILHQMLGEVDTAAHELDAALERMPADPLLWGIAVGSDFRTLQEATKAGLPLVGYGLYAALQDRSPADDQLRRPLVSNQKLRDFMAAPPMAGDTLVVVFTGTNDTAGMPLSIFDRYLASLGCNAVYLKDFRRLLFLRGLRSLGDRDTTLQAIRALQRQLGCGRLCTIGMSAGAFAAIHYGVELGADCILSFGAPTYHSPNLGGAAIQRRLYETFLSNWELDLRAFLQSRSYTSHINLFFGERELRDRAHALYLDDLDGVTLHPVSQLNDHECLRWFALNRDLRTLLGEWLGV